MANKKKHGKKATQPDNKKQQKASLDCSQQNATTTTNSPETNKAAPFTQPQLTALCFLSMGLSRLFEWKRAVHEITEQTESHLNGTGICQEYTMTNEEVDYSSICSTNVAATLVPYKYDTSLQLAAMVFALMIQCWHDEAYFHRLNTLLSLTPISTTLLLLQVCAPFITKSKSIQLTVTCAVLMAVSASSCISTIRELLLTDKATSSSKMPPRGRLQSMVLSSMVFLSGYEVFQWYQTYCSQGASGMLASSLVISEHWDDAFSVFFYAIIMDKFTMACLLTFAWWGLPEGRQRAFLFLWAWVQFAMYQYRFVEYKADAFADLATIHNAALACSVMSGIAWLAPSMSTSNSATTSSSSNKEKTS